MMRSPARLAMISCDGDRGDRADEVDGDDRVVAAREDCQQQNLKSGDAEQTPGIPEVPARNLVIQQHDDAPHDTHRNRIERQEFPGCSERRPRRSAALEVRPKRNRDQSEDESGANRDGYPVVARSADLLLSSMPRS